MHYNAAPLLSAAIFSLSAFARPPPPTQSNADLSTLDKRYVPGWCDVHIQQYQKDEGPVGSDGGTSEYRLDLNLFDNAQDPIGGVSKLSVPGGIFTGIDSQLPAVFEVLVGGADQQPVMFQYDGQAWTTADNQCSVGNYDSGSRNIDCGFNC